MTAGSAIAIGPGVELRDGRYRLERVLGTGGMASVWLGLDRRLDRPVAIKVLSDTLAADPDYVQRFRREAHTAARLSHPNLVKVFDFEPEGRPALIMEYVEGGTLDETANRPGTAVEVEALAVQLLGALEHIHAAGIVHRDVKPGNVLVGDDGRALLTDFGIAQHQDATRITQTGQVVGTLAYMAPEVLDGERATPQSDLYSCGVVLRDHLGPETAPRLRQLIDRLTERDPGLRPASARRALSYLAGSVPGAEDTTAVAVAPPADSLPPPPPPRPPRSPAATEAPREYAIRGAHVLAGLALLAAVIAVVVIVTGGDDASDGGSQGEPPATAAEAEQAQPAPEAPASEPAAGTPSSDAIPPPGPSPDPAQGAAFNDTGHAALQAGDYDKAVKELERALANFPEEARTADAFASDPNYAYALFNYGQALRLAGRPEEAIPVLEARLEIPDQTETVQAELDEAVAATGE